MACGVSRWRGWGVGQACRRAFGGCTRTKRHQQHKLSSLYPQTFLTNMITLQTWSRAGRAPPACARVVAARRVATATAAPRANRRPLAQPPPSLTFGQRRHHLPPPHSLPDADLAGSGDTGTGSGDTGIVSVEARALRCLAWCPRSSHLA